MIQYGNNHSTSTDITMFQPTNQVNVYCLLGPMLEVVTDNDIDAEVSESEAYTRYANPSVAFMVTQKQDLFDADVIYENFIKIEEIQAFTEWFLAPFREMKAMENKNGTKTPLMEKGKQSFFLSDICLLYLFIY